MNGKRICLAMVVTALVVISGISQAATFSLSGPGQTGDEIKVAPGANFTVNVAMDAPEAGNVFEVFVGFDVSDRSMPGLGGAPTINKLTMVSSTTDVANSVDAGFGVYRSAKVATAREANNSSLGGRPYGLKIVGARNGNTAGGQKTLCAVTFQNNIPSGESYYVVLSDNGSGASYTSAWKAGTTVNRGSYALKVTSGASLTPGDANGDGKVNFSDYLNFSAGFGTVGTPGTLWAQGDFNEDGVVNFSDYLILSQNFGSGGAVSAEEVAKFKAASANLNDAAHTDAVQQTLPCTPLAMALMAVIGLALYGLGSSFRSER